MIDSIEVIIFCPEKFDVLHLLLRQRHTVFSNFVLTFAGGTEFRAMSSENRLLINILIRI